MKVYSINILFVTSAKINTENKKYDKNQGNNNISRTLNGKSIVYLIYGASLSISLLIKYIVIILFNIIF